MNNRFTFKDFILLVLLAGVIIVVLLSMKQRDRQYEVLLKINDKLDQQTTDISQLRRAIQSGVRVADSSAAPTTQSTAEGWTPGGDVFKYVKAMQQKPDYATGDWYVDAFPVKVPILTPYIVQDLYGMYVDARVCEWLVTYDAATLNFVGVLAESWKISDDGLIVTFKLRRGVTFSDGEPFTADDVVFSYNWVMNPKVAAPRARSTLDKVKGCEKKGDYEIAFYFKEPFFEAMPTVGTIDIIPKHFVSKFTEEQYNTNPGILIGTGPYRMAKGPANWKPGDLIELVRNERYWGEPGPWDKIIWHEVPNETATETMFKNKELDIFAATPEQFHLLSQDKVLLKWARALEYVGPTSGYNYVAWNQVKNGKPSLFADKRVRQALTLLVDRQRFVDEIWYGHGEVGVGPFSPLSGQLDPNIKPLPFDPQRAIALLKEAGFEDRNGDGVIESPAGEPFKFSLVYSTGGPLGERIALFLKDSYAKAGIVLNPDPADWSILMKKLNERTFDAITLAWSTSVESDIYQMFHSSQIADQGDDFMSYKNQELDQVIEKARTTLDRDKRMALWHRAHQIIQEDQPYTFLVQRRNMGFMDNRIQNVDRSKLGLNYNNRYVLPIPWYVPKGNQKWK